MKQTSIINLTLLSFFFFISQMLLKEMTYFILNLNETMIDQICMKGHQTFSGPIKLPTSIISSGRVDSV